MSSYRNKMQEEYFKKYGKDMPKLPNDDLPDLFPKDSENPVLEAILTLQNMIKENTDDRPKEIGDRVKIWDMSYLIDIDGVEYYTLKSMVFTEPHINTLECIIVKTNEEFPYSSEDYTMLYHTDKDAVNLDLICYCPTFDKKFRVPSDSVKLLD